MSEFMDPEVEVAQLEEDCCRLDIALNQIHELTKKRAELIQEFEAKFVNWVQKFENVKNSVEKTNQQAISEETKNNLLSRLIMVLETLERLRKLYEPSDNNGAVGGDNISGGDIGTK